MTPLRTTLGKRVARSLTAAFSLKTKLTTTANKIPAGRVYRKEGLSVPHDVPLGVPSKVRYSAAAMAEVYRHPEVLDVAPFGMARIIYAIHPFRTLWNHKPHGK